MFNYGKRVINLEILSALTCLKSLNRYTKSETFSKRSKINNCSCTLIVCVRSKCTIVLHMKGVRIESDF